MTAETIYQSTATYTCNPGYTRSGDQLRICQANGDWSGSAPVCNREYCLTINLLTTVWCLAIDCGPLTINNGQVSTSGTTFMMTATYTCDDGYTLNGGNIRTCQANEMWSGSDPTCDRKFKYSALATEISMYPHRT